MTLSRRIGVVEINTQWHLLAKKRTKLVSFHRDWNDLPDSLISSAEMSDDCVSKFTSFVKPTPGAPLGKFGVSPATSKPFRKENTIHSQVTVITSK